MADEVVVEIVESAESTANWKRGKDWKEQTEQGKQIPEAKQLIQLAGKLGCKLVKKLGTLPFFQFKIPAGKTPTQVCEEFEVHPDMVRSAEPNGVVKPRSYTPYAFPNDTYYQD